MSIPTFRRVCIGELNNAPEMNTLFNVADLNGDGRTETVLSEGVPCIYGHREGGKLTWFNGL